MNHGAPRYYLISLILLGSLGISLAQNPFKYSEHYTKDQGLPVDRTTSITEDNAGFWWIGTTDGLARFDGALFKVYKHEENNPNSIIDNRVRDLHFDGKHLWIATHIGISKFDLLTGRIKNYTWTYQCESVSEYDEAQEAVQVIHEDPQGGLWIGTQHCGFAKYFPENDAFQLFTPDTSEIDFSYSRGLEVAHKIRSKNVHAIITDIHNDSVIWIGSNSSLIRFNRYTETSEYITRFYTDDEWAHQAYTFHNLFQDVNGLLYTGTNYNRLATYDPSLKKFGATPDANGPAQFILGSGIRAFTQINDSIMWITTTKGLVEYDFRHREYGKVYKNKFDHLSFYGANYIDQFGRILVESLWGLFVFDPIQQQFELSTFKDLNQGDEGYVYAVTHDTIRNRYYACARRCNGLYYFDITAGEWNRITFPSEFFNTEFPSFNDMSMTQSGKYLVATQEDILFYDPIDHSFENIPVDIPLSVRKFNDVFVDSRNVAWINSREDGVFAWNINDNNLTQYTFPVAPLTIAAADSETFVEDSRGRIWMKRRKGYSVYDPFEDQIQHFAVSDMHGSYNGAFAEDNDGYMWIANVTGWLGAVHIDSIENGIVKRITIQGAKKSNTLSALAIGPQDKLWCVMKEALIIIDPKTEAQTSYNFNYGNNPNELFSFQFMENGTMVFGKRSEIVLADPNSLKINQELPKPYIMEVNIGSSPLISDTVHNQLKSLHLGARENFFSFRFSTIGMSFGRENSIQYRLAGFQDNWIDAQDQRLASYTNVPSGNYTFELRASNNEGFPNPDILRFPVTIGTPWYATVLAKFVMVLIILVIIYSAYRIRISQIRKEERLRTEFQRKLADVEMSALRAQMNPHFIFNCLNSIENFVIKNDTLRASTYLNDFARLIRLILQNSRSRHVLLTDEIESLQLYLQMESLRFTDKFDYELFVGENIDPRNIEIPPMLIQPYVENAIWHGLMHKKSTGRLDISLSQKDGILLCLIEDNGIGRKKSMEINAARKVKKKKSMGMSITADRIKLLNELYSMNTEVIITDLLHADGTPQGTRVEIHIPL